MDKELIHDDNLLDTVAEQEREGEREHEEGPEHLQEHVPAGEGPSTTNTNTNTNATAEAGGSPASAEEGPVEEEDVFRNVGLGLDGHYKEIMIRYWQELINEIESTNEPGSQHQDDFKSHSLPFARIRRVMKTDEDVKMISAEAPIIFAKACEVFITELTMRAWCVAEKHKRRTLQKADIAEALQKSDMFDFLIDIVPREK